MDTRSDFETVAKTNWDFGKNGKIWEGGYIDGVNERLNLKMRDGGKDEKGGNSRSEYNSVSKMKKIWRFTRWNGLIKDG